MKMLLKAAAVAGLLSLAACGGSGDDALGDNAADQAEATADNIEEQAENATNDSTEDALEDKAEAVRENGQDTEEKIDDSDVRVNQQ
jgi:ABC-type glycerol-3-phosphate transport system substrate-binding protein